MRGEVIGIDALYFAAARYYRSESAHAKIAGLIDESKSLATLAKRLDATAYKIQARIVYHARIKADIEARNHQIHGLRSMQIIVDDLFGNTGETR